jgi:hypothetical protein
MLKLGTLAVTLLICAWSPAVSAASDPVKLDMQFTPYRLGSATTIVFGFNIGDAPGTQSSPVTKVDLSLPSTIAYDTSTLGLASCLPERLSQKGLAGCSPNSRIGLGTGLVAVPFGTGTLTESVHITTLVGNSENGHIEVIYYATGNTPVISELIMPGEIVSNPSGEHIVTSVPLVPTLPGAPDAAVIKFRATIGPSHLYYYERVHGKRVRYQPRGIALPASCPPEGFPFSARFGFQDGSEVTARDTVRCPNEDRRTGDRARHKGGTLR